ncbi:dolichyl-phosphate-mannose--protein mannosyltransferase [Ruicaihuangia caeni]|uniref:dolichyl-phosphate-mannose--protein mannosyltransferase n=1 Tax=Ruicaihuangia caeni TaxID=3042517 RepID=UPI00338E26AE
MSAGGAAVSAATPHGSRIDAWLGRSAGARRAWRVGAPALVLLTASVLRFWNLGHPHELVFDETYYVKDAWTLFNLGYESRWPEGANAAWAAGDPNGYSTDASFVVHPPLGKWIIALGLAAFGAADPVGWRFSTAVAGVVLVALVMVAAHVMFRSTAVTALAGGLLAIDGNAIVMSRVGLLDGLLAVFVLAGFICWLLDRRWAGRRLREWAASRQDAKRGLEWGPALWWRPWLIAMGVLLGAASAVKWSGLYVLAFFAVGSLIADAIDRRRAGISFWASGTVLKQGPVSFVLTVPVALAVYLVSFTGWFVTDGGYSRHWAGAVGEPWTGALAWVPLDWQSFWHYQSAVYDYHVGETRPHGYQAFAWTWLLLIRPTGMYYRTSGMGDAGCRFDQCASAITGIANPIIWWASVAAVLALVVLLFARRRLVRLSGVGGVGGLGGLSNAGHVADPERALTSPCGQAGAILLGLAAGYLPWLLYPERTVFQFYTIVFEPFLVLALAMVLGLVLGRSTDAAWRRQSGIGVVAVFLVFAVLVSAFFWPLWTAMPVWVEFTRLHYWLPGWR